MTTFLKNKAESRKARQTTSGPRSARPSKPNAFRTWQGVQPAEASRFRKAYVKARKIKPHARTKEQQGICNFGESLGLNEDDPFSEESDDENGSDYDPEDQSNVAESAIPSVEPPVTHSSNLTYVHPACHAVGGPSTSNGSSSKTVSGTPKSVAFARCTGAWPE